MTYTNSMAWNSLTHHSIADAMLIGYKVLTLMMLKLLMLQNWYRSSDPVLDKQFAQDLLFQRFSGLDISKSAPDHTPFGHFIQTLDKMCLALLNLMEGLLSESNRKLSTQCRSNNNQDGFIKSTVYADNTYQSHTHKQWPVEQNIDNRITKRAHYNKLLDKKVQHFNRTQPGVRCTVEPVFFALKRCYGIAHTRYLGPTRKCIRFKLMCMAHNLKQGSSIQPTSYASKMKKQQESTQMLKNLLQIGLFRHLFVKITPSIKCGAK